MCAHLLFEHSEMESEELEVIGHSQLHIKLKYKNTNPQEYQIIGSSFPNCIETNFELLMDVRKHTQTHIGTQESITILSLTTSLSVIITNVKKPA